MRFGKLTKVDLYFSPRHGGEIVLFCRPTFTDIFGFVPLAPPRVIFRIFRHKFGAMAYFVGNVIMSAVIAIDAQFTLFFGGPAVYRPGIVGANHVQSYRFVCLHSQQMVILAGSISSLRL